MFIRQAIELEQALRWMTTTGFENSPLAALAVVLTRDADSAFEDHLHRHACALHFGSEYALAMAIGTRTDLPVLPQETNREVQHWLESLYRTRTAYGEAAPTSRHLAGVLELLGLPEASLPCLYVRWRAQPAMVIPLPDAETAQVLLRDIMYATWRGRDSPFSEFQQKLVERGFGALIMPAFTQRAIDAAFTPPPTAPTEPGRDEDRGGTRAAALSLLSQGGAIKASETVERAAQYLPSPEHLLCLKTAQYASGIGDWGTVCVNIARVIEASITGSLLHAVRGIHGIDLPLYIDRYDPGRGSVVIKEAELNAKQWPDSIGCWSPLQFIPWKPPTIRVALDAIRASTSQLPFYLPDAWLNDFDVLARRIAELRNPPAHGAVVPEAHAASAWNVLDDWVHSGCARASRSLRAELARWPTIRRDVVWVPGTRETKPMDIANRWLEEANHLVKASEVSPATRKRASRLQQLIASFSRLKGPRPEPADLETVSKLLAQLPDDADRARLQGLVRAIRMPDLAWRRLGRDLEGVFHLPATNSRATAERALATGAPLAERVMAAIDAAIDAGTLKYRSEARKRRFMAAVQAAAATSATQAARAAADLAELRLLVSGMLPAASKLADAAADELHSADNARQLADKQRRCAQRIHQDLGRADRPTCICGHHPPQALWDRPF